jgi:hypothetical protein
MCLLKCAESAVLTSSTEKLNRGFTSYPVHLKMEEKPVSETAWFYYTWMRIKSDTIVPNTPLTVIPLLCQDERKQYYWHSETLHD